MLHSKIAVGNKKEAEPDRMRGENSKRRFSFPIARLKKQNNHEL